MVLVFLTEKVFIPPKYKRLTLYMLLLSMFSHVPKFQYYKQHQYWYCSRFLSQLLNTECHANDKRNIIQFWFQFNIKVMIVTHFSFYTFSLYDVIYRLATPCITTVVCIRLSLNELSLQYSLMYVLCGNVQLHKYFTAVNWTLWYTLKFTVCDFFIVICKAF